MAYVIAEPCINTKDTACVDVCPVDCIHPRKDEPAYQTETMLYISPVECIDCGACVPVCPVSAIFGRLTKIRKLSQTASRRRFSEVPRAIGAPLRRRVIRRA